MSLLELGAVKDYFATVRLIQVLILLVKVFSTYQNVENERLELMIKVFTHMKYVLPVVFIYDVFPSHFPEVAIVIFYFPISKAFGSLHIT